MAMQDEFTVLESLRDLLSDNSDLIALLGIHSKNIGINVPLNEDFTNCPWAGIYHTRTTTTPHTTGRGWKQTFDMVVVVQSSDLNDADRCMRKLTGIVKEANDSLTQDTTIKNSVDMVTNIDTTYTNTERDNDGVHFQAALINITAEVRSNAR